MKKDTLINIRVTKSLKESFQTIVEKNGFSMSEVLEAMMLDVSRKGKVPLSVQSKIDRKVEPLITVPFIKKCLDETLSKNKDARIKSVSLFGSYARGEATNKSDVDLFLEVDMGYDLFSLGGLQIELEASIGKKVDLVTNDNDPVFMNHIKREWIRLYERSA